jgi:hypothetical protein
LQTVRCHTASSEKKALANPMAIYAILSIILIDGLSRNHLLFTYPSKLCKSIMQYTY